MEVVAPGGQPVLPEHMSAEEAQFLMQVGIHSLVHGKSGASSAALLLQQQQRAHTKAKAPTKRQLLLYGGRQWKKEGEGEAPHAHLLHKKLAADVVFLVGDEEVPFLAHRRVLEEVVPKLLPEDTHEGRHFPTLLPDVDPHVFSEVLRFAYTNAVFVGNRFAHGLLRASLAFELHGLADLCAKHAYQAGKLWLETRFDSAAMGALLDIGGALRVMESNPERDVLLETAEKIFATVFGRRPHWTLGAEAHDDDDAPVAATAHGQQVNNARFAVLKDIRERPRQLKPAPVQRNGESGVLHRENLLREIRSAAYRKRQPQGGEDGKRARHEMFRSLNEGLKRMSLKSNALGPRASVALRHGVGAARWRPLDLLPRDEFALMGSRVTANAAALQARIDALLGLGSVLPPDLRAQVESLLPEAQVLQQRSERLQERESQIKALAPAVEALAKEVSFASGSLALLIDQHTLPPSPPPPPPPSSPPPLPEAREEGRQQQQFSLQEGGEEEGEGEEGEAIRQGGQQRPPVRRRGQQAVGAKPQRHSVQHSQRYQSVREIREQGLQKRDSVGSDAQQQQQQRQPLRRHSSKALVKFRSKAERQADMQRKREEARQAEEAEKERLKKQTYEEYARKHEAPPPDLAPIATNVVVVVRCRPLSRAEFARMNKSGETDFVFAEEGTRVRVVLPQKKNDYLRAGSFRDFGFDRAFSGPAVGQEDIYDVSTRPLVRNLLDGVNGTVFAYGQTGSGKTYTMIGTASDPGLVPLAMAEVFELAGELRRDDYRIFVSFLEIYNEAVKDLLGEDEGELEVRDDDKGASVVVGLTEEEVTGLSAGDIVDIVSRGNTKRTTKRTNANMTSSRSHAIFQIRFRRLFSTGARDSLLSLVDLAGSERAKKTGNTGQEMVESQNINQSLLCLGSCINALAQKQAYVPYRGSKMTRLLKESLSGNCRTTMICAVSPLPSEIEETLNTLKYASEARNIRTTVRRKSIKEWSVGEDGEGVGALRKSVSRRSSAVGLRRSNTWADSDRAFKL